jgi:predicted Rossmann-fold nucleotide-binding protein
MKDQNKKYIHILSSAEAFGFGPCSKLTSIVKSLKNDIPYSRIDFLGEGSALSFALQNHHLFNNIKEYDGVYPNANEFDLVLSVMNPYIVLWGWFHRKKCIYVDSLYWFWKFEKNIFKKLESTIDQLTNATSLNEVWALIKDIDGHNLHYIAHRLSTISCSQYFNGTEIKTDVFRKNIKNLVEVNPIIDASYKKEAKRDTILISLGGLLSPLNREKEALSYVGVVLKIAEDFISEASKHYKVILATSPEMAKLIKGTNQDIAVTTLSQEEMLKTINRSSLVLTPAGITTMYECLMYETPFFVLPELHDGHYPNYLRLAGGNKKKIKALPSVFPNALINPLVDNRQETYPDDEIRKIQSFIKKLNITNDKTFNSMKSNVNDLLALILDRESLKKMAKNQKKFALGNAASRNKNVIDVIKKGIEREDPPTICKKHTVGIISSAIPVRDKKTIDLFNSLGTHLAKHNINIATGAAVGISHLVGKSAKDAGSKLIGFSPNTNALTHSRKPDNAPITHFDIIHFNSNGFTARSLEFIETVDALIMVSGRMGTLSEFTIGFEEGVPIFILKGYGGVSDRIEEIISFADKKGLVPPAVFTDAKKLAENLLFFLRSNYYK